MLTPRGYLGVGLQYGLGIMLWTDVFGTAYGHDGSAAGFSTHLTYRPIQGGTSSLVVVLMNTQGVDATGFAARLWNELLR